jgi:glycerol uptake facilitator-like aquaporin
MAGLTFVLSGGAAILARYGGYALLPWQTVLVLSLISALWPVVAVYFLGDISSHFNPAMTLAFALRRDMGWVTAGPVSGARRVRVAVVSAEGIVSWVRGVRGWRWGRWR